MKKLRKLHTFSGLSGNRVFQVVAQSSSRPWRLRLWQSRQASAAREPGRRSQDSQCSTAEAKTEAQPAS